MDIEVLPDHSLYLQAKDAHRAYLEAKDRGDPTMTSTD